MRIYLRLRTCGTWLTAWISLPTLAAAYMGFSKFRDTFRVPSKGYHKGTISAAPRAHRVPLKGFRVSEI